MSAAGFWRDVAIGFALSAAGAIALYVLTPILGIAFTERLLVLGLAGAYLAALMVGVRARIGRLVVALAWVTLAAALAVFSAPIGLWILTQLVLAWLVRSLYRHDGLISAGIDAAITAFAVAASAFALGRTHSAFLGLWTFFLVQALCMAIPRRDGRAPVASTPVEPRFDQAYRSAEDALRRLSLRGH